MSDTTSADNVLQVRRVPFEFPDRSAGHWNQAKPEFSQVVNSASLAMPYLEPYLIASMRQAQKLITCPELLAQVDLYIRQEATHFRHHKAFNKTLADAGYTSVPALEALLGAHFFTHGSGLSSTVKRRRFVGERQESLATRESVVAHLHCGYAFL